MGYIKSMKGKKSWRDINLYLSYDALVSLFSTVSITLALNCSYGNELQSKTTLLLFSILKQQPNPHLSISTNPLIIWHNHRPYAVK